MQQHSVCLQDGDIALHYAIASDKKMIFDMIYEDPLITKQMFYGGYTFTWEDFNSEDDCYYSGDFSKYNYLLVQFKGELIGSISHSYNDAPIKNMELDIWLRSAHYTGKGIGPKTIQLLINYLNEKHMINTFIIRPSIRNMRAIKAYSKCGFIHLDDFKPELYYNNDDLMSVGDGDYGTEETYNMVLTL